MSRDPGAPTEPTPSRGEHVTTLSYNGRFWDVFMEMENDPRQGGLVRALLCFSPSDLNAGEKPTRTGAIIVEPSYQDALDKARSMDQRQLSGLLRSSLPD